MLGSTWFPIQLFSHLWYSMRLYKSCWLNFHFGLNLLGSSSSFAQNILSPACIPTSLPVVSDDVNVVLGEMYLAGNHAAHNKWTYQNVIDYELVCYAFIVHFAIVQLLRQFNRFFIELIHFLFVLFFNSFSHMLDFHTLADAHTLPPTHSFTRSKQRCRHIAYRTFNCNQCIDGKSTSHFHLAWKLAILLERKFPLFARRISRCYRDYCAPICVILNMNFRTIICFFSSSLSFSFFSLFVCTLCTALHISNRWNAPILFKTVCNSNGSKFCKEWMYGIDSVWWLPILRFVHE